MSFCSKCGTQIENPNQQFCTNCGAKVETAPVPKATPVYAEQTPVAQNPNFAPIEPIVQHSMKWFKFLIYFSLFFGAFINFVFGFNYISGGIYFVQTNGQVTADAVYSMYGGLKALDVIYGILMIAMAAFAVYTRFRLSKYKVDGPMCVYILYGAGTALSIIYNVALLVVTGLNQIASSVPSILISGLFVFLNYKYFSKRKELFINK